MCQTCAMLQPNADSCAFQPIKIDTRVVFEDADAAAGPSTAYSIEVGETFQGRISPGGEADWVAVDLVGGESYDFGLAGITLSDPVLTILDADGNVVVFDDDSGDELLDSAIRGFRASETGTYYIEAAGFSAVDTGTYAITTSLRENTANPDFWTDAQIADQLTDGFWESVGQTARRFDVAPGGTITVNLDGLNSAGRGLAQAALDVWADISGLIFREVSFGADITFNDSQFGAYAASDVRNGEILESIVNVGLDWLNAYGTDIDGYSFQTYVHEIGHALGLGHAGNYNGGAVYGVDNAYLNDSWQGSVMSYFTQEENPNVDASFAFVVTPMAADVLAIRNLYGTPGDLRDGDTQYGDRSAAGGIYDDLQNLDGPVTFTIVDEGGTDRLELRSSAADQRVDLRPGASSDLWGLVGNMVIDHATLLEEVRTGAGADDLTGNAAANFMSGGGGRDRIDGLDGDDFLRGLPGGDTVFGSGGNDFIGGGAGDDDLSGGGGADTIRGGAGNDTLSGDGGFDDLLGGAGNDTLLGGNGGDILKGAWGDDILTGGDGSDMFVFKTGHGSDVITDFDPTQDTIQLSGGIRDQDAVEVADGSDGAILHLDGGEVLVEGVAAIDLTADVFEFI